MEQAIPRIPIARYRLVYSFDPPLKLPTYAGSAWRGALGTRLKQAVCVVRNTPCKECLLRSSCAYTYVFETPPPPGTTKMRRYDAAPHPFVLIPGEGEGANGRYTLGINLFGRGNHYLPYVVLALQQAGAGGLGGARQSFDLQAVEQSLPDGQWRSIYAQGAALTAEPPAMPQAPADIPARLTVTLHTPLRVKRQGSYVGAGQFQFSDFFGSLLRRHSMLSYFHTDTPLETDFAGLMAQSRAVPVHSADLRWHDWTRYSSRQQTEMQMGGLLGCFQLEGKHLASFWPYLWLGQWTHGGKGTSMGLGRYTLGAASLPDRTAADGQGKMAP